MGTELIYPKAGKVRVKRDGIFIILESEVKAWPWKAALEVARVITATAKEIENDINAGRIVDDQAILIRLGVPLGLTDNKALLHAANIESQHSSKLRRFITGSRVKGIPSAERLGTPSLIQGKPE